MADDSEELQRCLSDLNKVVGDLEKVVYGERAVGKLGLEIIIYGSDELGVEPMRDTLNRIATAYDRIVWLLGILGISTLAGLVGWALFLFNRTPVP